MGENKRVRDVEGMARVLCRKVTGKMFAMVSGEGGLVGKRTAKLVTEYVPKTANVLTARMAGTTALDLPELRPDVTAQRPGYPQLRP